MLQHDKNNVDASTTFQLGNTTAAGQECRSETHIYRHSVTMISAPTDEYLCTKTAKQQPDELGDSEKKFELKKRRRTDECLMLVGAVSGRFPAAKRNSLNSP